MITRETLAKWRTDFLPRHVNQEVIYAYEHIRDSNYQLDPSISFREFSSTVTDLADKMQSSISLGRNDDLKSKLYSHATQVYDHRTMADCLDDFEALFQKGVSQLREQRDTRRWDEIALSSLCSALERNVEVMSAASLTRFFEHSVSFSVKQTEYENLPKTLFFGVDKDFEGIRDIFTTPGLFSLIKHGVADSLSSDVLGSPGRVESALQTAKIFTKLKDAGIRLQAWQLDMLLVLQVTERLVLAHSASESEVDRHSLALGVGAMADVFCRRDGDAPTVRSNCFRPYLRPTDWKWWADEGAMDALSRGFQGTIQSIDAHAAPEVVEAIDRLKMRLLVDATICAQSLAPPKNGKQSKIRHACAVSMANLIRDLVPRCEAPMSQPGAMTGLNARAKVVLVGLLPEGAVRKQLLSNNRRLRGEVLMDDLGI